MNFFSLSAERVPEYGQFLSALLSGGANTVRINGLPPASKAHFIAAAVTAPAKTGAVCVGIVVIVDRAATAVRMANDINAIAGLRVAAALPALDTNLSLFGAKVTAVSEEYTRERVSVLHEFAQGIIRVIVAHGEAAAQYTLPPQLLAARTLHILPGREYSSLAATLVSLGYERCELVTSQGMFAVRGSIADIYPVNCTAPLRVEFWGDEVDTISVFDTESQRRIDTVKELYVAPAREHLGGVADATAAADATANATTTATAADGNALLAARLTAIRKSSKAKTPVHQMLTEDIAVLTAAERSLPAPEKYASLLYETEATLFDYAKRVIVCESDSVISRYKDVYKTHLIEIEQLFAERRMCRGLDRFLLSPGDFTSEVETRAAVYLDSYSMAGENVITGDVRQIASWSGELGKLVAELCTYKGYAVAVFAGTDKAARTLADDLSAANKTGLSDYDDDGDGKADGGASKKCYGRGFCKSVTYGAKINRLMSGVVQVVPGTTSSGFHYPRESIAVLSLYTARDYSDTAASSAISKTRKNKKGLTSIDDIAAGDYVVHNEYGIAVFEGVVSLDSKDATGRTVSRDYIRLKYYGSDSLYIPVTQLDVITRYAGATDGAAVKLTKLGGDRWRVTKAKARAAAEEFAEELVELYRVRLSAVGYKFPADNEKQREFENHFSFVETEDQLRCIDEIKSDMGDGKPMDRLLCGDVGFGKTEVALRAAFKCVASGKQTALLCPTTVLAWQHYQTALRRMEGFGVRIELLSRFRSAKETRVIQQKLLSGQIDFIIGTHSIVNDSVRFHDLGLAVIDEEQRFGVKHKERFKERYPTTDILTLSATPIPRTLNMALSGLRDMSVIEQPPHDRQPVMTYVMPQDEGVITSALSRELRRGGQGYYVHNRTETIYDCAARLREALPEARVGVAHGKMSETELLGVWRGLLEQKIDILVCTTIIETGVDVPNCNTLVIERADLMGLAQLHQLRGRVGRSGRRAYAYFMWKADGVPTELAEKRLDAIRAFTEFGAGFRIASRDLQLRGAGSVLGRSQSGHMSAVGYNMYVKMLETARRRLESGDTAAGSMAGGMAGDATGVGAVYDDERNCPVDIKVDAYIPDTYISSGAERLKCYKRISEIRDATDYSDVADELVDRYGEPPRSVLNLLDIAVIRGLALSRGIGEIVQVGGRVTLYCDSINAESALVAGDCLSGSVALQYRGRTGIVIVLGKGEQPAEAVKLFLDRYGRAA